MAGSSTISCGAASDLLHLLEVGELHRAPDALGREIGVLALALDAHEQLADDVGPAVVDEVDGLGLPGHERVEVLHPLGLPPRLERCRPVGVGRAVVADVDRRRRALEDVQLVRTLAEVRHALHGGGAGADDADPLAGEPGEAAVGSAAGVVVVPPAGVERVAGEVVDALDAGQFGAVQRSVRHGDEPGPHLVAMVGRHDPSLFVGRRQRSAVTSVWRQALCVQVVVLADRTAVGEDLGGAYVLLARHVVRALRAAEDTRTTRRRTSRPGSDSSTTCRRSRRPSRSAGCS